MTPADSAVQLVDQIYTRYRGIQGKNDSIPSWLTLVREYPGPFAPGLVRALERVYQDQLQRGGDAVDPGYDWFTGMIDVCDRYVPRNGAFSGDTLFVPVLCARGQDTLSEAGAIVGLRKSSKGWQVEDVGYFDGATLHQMLADFYENDN